MLDEVIRAAPADQIQEDMDETLMEKIHRDLEGMSKIPGLSVTDILDLPRSVRLFLRRIILSKAVTCEQVAGFLGETEDEARRLLDTLDELGLIERLPICGAPKFWVRLNPRRLRPPAELLNMSEG